MFYIRRHLGQGERILHQTMLHWVSFVRQLLFFSFSVVIYPDLTTLVGNPAPGILLIAIGSSALLVALLRFWIEEYVVTNRRVISRYGILRRAVHSFPLGRIEAIDIRQSLTGRLLNYGAIEIHTAAERDGVATRRLVNRPEAWRAAILAAIDREQHQPPAPETPVAAENDPETRLRRLAALQQQGLISDQEYQDRRQAILREL